MQSSAVESARASFTTVDLSEDEKMASKCFLLVSETSPNTFSTETFHDEKAARAESARRLRSHCLFETASDTRTLIREVSYGGLGFGHAAIRRHVSKEMLNVGEPDSFLLLLEKGAGNIVEERHETVNAARVSARKHWCSFVIYAESAGGALREVSWGGLGFAHDTIRRFASNRSDGLLSSSSSAAAGASSSSAADAESTSAVSAGKLREKASLVSDEELAQPLRDAVDLLEAQQPPPLPPSEPTTTTTAAAAAATSVSESGDGGAASSSPPPLRSLFGEALSQSDDSVAANGLVKLMQACIEGAREGGADDLIATLVAALEAEPPTDGEMVRLRGMSTNETLNADGAHGYAICSSWVAALFVRTERCIAARSRLTEAVMKLGLPQREMLKHAGGRLVSEAVPELLQLFGELAALVAKMTNDIGVQEVAVRTSKGVSAAMSITGTIMVFTPLMPVGVGLLASAAGVGLTTATGDAIGQHVQKEDLRKGLDRLNECERRVLLNLEALVTACFPDVKEEEWAAARGAGISFEALPPEQIGNTLFAVGGATARGSAVLATRIGATVSTQILSVFGAVVASGDFVYSMLTNSPNRKSIKEVSSFLEGKSESYRVWLVLLKHWLSLNQRESRKSAVAMELARRPFDSIESVERDSVPLDDADDASEGVEVAKRIIGVATTAAAEAEEEEEDDEPNPMMRRDSRYDGVDVSDVPANSCNGEEEEADDPLGARSPGNEAKEEEKVADDAELRHSMMMAIEAPLTPRSKVGKDGIQHA